MSTKDNTPDVTTNATTPTTTATADPSKDIITTVIPKRYAREKSRTIVANGEYRRFPVGKEVKMPRPFYENLKRSEDQRSKFEKMVDKLVDETGKPE